MTLPSRSVAVNLAMGKLLPCGVPPASQTTPGSYEHEKQRVSLGPQKLRALARMRRAAQARTCSSGASARSECGSLASASCDRKRSAASAASLGSAGAQTATLGGAGRKATGAETQAASPACGGIAHALRRGASKRSLRRYNAADVRAQRRGARGVPPPWRRHDARRGASAAAAVRWGRTWQRGARPRPAPLLAAAAACFPRRRRAVLRGCVRAEAARGR